MLLPLVLCSLAPQGPHLVAAVNDPQSHGLVGDAMLSLDEAIRVTNGTLALSTLSAAEQARFTGTGPLVEAIVIDATVTPTITVQQPLTPVVGPTTVHQHVEILGMGHPTIQGGAVAKVFTFHTYNAALHELHLVGGQVALEVQVPHPTMPSAHMAHVEHCEFHGQTVAAIRTHGTGTDESMVMVLHSEFHMMPVAFLIDDQTTGGMVMVEAERVHLDGVTLGCKVIEAGVGANMSMFNMFRSTFVNGTTLAEKRRTATSTQQFMFRIVFTDADCSGHVLDVEGNPIGLTMVHHHHGDFVAGAGQKALWTWPRTAQFDVHGSEMVFEGDVAIGANLISPRIWQQNCAYKNGTVTFDVDGSLPNLLWNRYENVAFTVPVTARSPVALRGSELTNTTVDSASFLAPITLQGCRRVGGSVTGFASETQPAPAAFLGTTTVTPAEPQVGTSLTLSTDLPQGIGLIWDLVISYARPTTTAEPVRFYGDPSTVVILPGMVQNQSTTTVPIPNDPAIAGFEFYVQGIALPMLGQSWVPAYHLPRGQLVWLQP